MSNKAITKIESPSEDLRAGVQPLPAKPLTNEKGEVRELTREEMGEFRPLGEVLPELAAIVPKRKRGERGRQKAPTKIPVTLRLDGVVVEYFRATGKGWQSRINDVLRKAVNSES